MPKTKAKPKYPHIEVSRKEIPTNEATLWHPLSRLGEQGGARLSGGLRVEVSPLTGCITLSFKGHRVEVHKNELLAVIRVAKGGGI